MGDGGAVGWYAFRRGRWTTARRVQFDRGSRSPAEMIRLAMVVRPFLLADADCGQKFGNTGAAEADTPEQCALAALAVPG